MSRAKWFLLGASSILLLSGCVVRTYPEVKDRVDQNLNSGNRGYLKGTAPAETKERKTTRTINVVEIELGQPTKAQKGGAAASSREMPYTPAVEYTPTAQVTENPRIQYEKYTVHKNDTLQKISQKFYGTTKRWKKIYEANQDSLKGPNKLRPGQVINIPVEALKEPKENLK